MKEHKKAHSFYVYVRKTVRFFCNRLTINLYCGEWGIRTPGTVIPYVSLANWWFQPLTQLSGRRSGHLS